MKLGHSPLISKSVEEPYIDRNAMGHFCVFVNQSVNLYATHFESPKFRDSLEYNYEPLLTDAGEEPLLRSLIVDWTNNTFLHGLFDRLTYDFDTKEFVGIVGDYFINHIILIFTIEVVGPKIKIDVSFMMDTDRVGVVSPPEALSFISDNEELVDTVFNSHLDVMFIIPLADQIISNAPEDLLDNDKLIHNLLEDDKILQIVIENTSEEGKNVRFNYMVKPE